MDHPTEKQISTPLKSTMFSHETPDVLHRSFSAIFPTSTGTDQRPVISDRYKFAFTDSPAQRSESEQQTFLDQRTPVQLNL